MTNPTTVEVKTPTLDGAPRRFYEVFGDAVLENQFLRNSVILLSGLCFALGLAVLFEARKPPLVIRVDNIGQPVVFDDIHQNNAATTPEIKNFAKFFTDYLLRWDSYTYLDDEKHVVEMSTPHGAQAINRLLTDLHSHDYIAQNKVRSEIVFTEIVVDKDTPSAVRVIVRGTRTIRSYSDDRFYKEISFEDTIVAVKVDRSLATPWGLLVDDWQEKIFKGAL